MDSTMIGRYHILERLGQGGMGVVYRAFDPQIERTVAIKVISAQLVDQPEHRERFFREARAAGRLTHRNIITIFDLGEDNGQPYIAMEYVEGMSLDVRMRTGDPLSLPQKVGIVIDICDALAFAHGAGIVHRDMKPPNIMLTPGGSVRILDFGLARLVTSELTRSNVVVGTMNYMAPEQVRAEAIDHRADIFSVGVLFYELLCGRKAFEADSFAATMYKVLQERPEPIASINAEVPEAIVAIVDRAIEKAREDRYQSMGDMLCDLEEVRAALPPAQPIRMPGDSVSRAPASSSRPRSVRAPELETTLDAPRVLLPSRTILPSGNARRADTQRVPAAAPPFEAPVSAAPDPERSGFRSSLAAADVASRASRFFPLISAAALVVIAGAVIAFVIRSPGERAARREDPARATAPAPPVAPAPGTVSSPQGGHPSAVSITDDVGQQTESARALYRAGKYDEAARAAGRVLQRSPENVDAQRLMTDLARYARQAALDAVSGLAATRAHAESVGARSAASRPFARAVERERSARALLAASDYGRATTAAYAAQGLYDAAAAQAVNRSEPRTGTDAAAAPAVPPRTAADQPSAPVPFPSVAGAPAPPPLGSAAPAPAAPAAPVAPQPTAAGSAPASASGEHRIADPQDAIRRVLQQYAAALEARSLQALKQVWPGLGGAQAGAIKTEFDNARQITVTLESPRIQVTSDTATVVATRRYSLATMDGHELRSDARSTFQLRATGGTWVIESVRFDAAR